MKAMYQETIFILIQQILWLNQIFTYVMKMLRGMELVHNKGVLNCFSLFLVLYI